MKASKKAHWHHSVRRHELRIPLGNDLEIYGRYTLSQGRVAEFAVVLSHRAHETDGRQICRYDTAHGYPHLDLLDRKGKLVRKIKLTHLGSYQDALEYALADFKENHEAYAERFFAA